MSENIDYLFISVADGGGVRSVNASLANGVAKLNYVVGVASCTSGAPFYDGLSDKIKFYKLGSKKNPLIFFITLGLLLVKEKPKTIFCSQDQVILPLAILVYFKIYKGKKVGVVHNHHLEHLKSRKLLARHVPKFMKWAYRRMDKIISVSSGLMMYLINQGYVRQDMVTTIYNPVIDDVFDLNTYISIGDDISLNQLGSYIVAAGNFNEQKDFVTLIKAFKFISDRYNGKLVILGEGILRNKLEKLIEDYGLLNRVLLPGFVNNPKSYFANADTFVLSSRWEGFGNVIVEALSVGCTVVSTDCNYGPREILMDGKYGYLADVGCAESLGEAILQSLRYPIPSHLSIDRSKCFKLSKSVNAYVELAKELQ